MTDHVKVYGVKPRIQYTANGTSTSFDFSFAIFKTSDVNVYFGDTLQNSSTYTVSGCNNSEGGTVTFNTAPTAGTIITIVRNLSIERTTDFQEGGTLRAEVLNDELDYQIACQQQIAENLNRSMVLPPYATDNDLDLTLPTPSAGKAIVWNSTGTNLENSTVSVNALESTLNSYKTQAQTAATTATNQASAAATQAQTATTQASIATTKASEAANSLNQINGMRTNCVTQIPQDIKLELNNGTLTIKAGSSFYYPKSSGVFARISTASDIVASIGAPTGKRMLFVTTNEAGTTFTTFVTANGTSSFSGPSAPTVAVQTAYWYDTENNIIKKTQDTGSTWNTTPGTYICFPICVATFDSGSCIAIEQIFNGFGYIGNTFYVLPNTKALISDGFNANGTPKNIEITTDSVKIVTTSSNRDKTYLCLTINKTLTISSLLSGEKTYYDENKNMFFANQTDVGGVTVPVGIFSTSTGINSFSLNTVFHGVDYTCLKRGDIIPTIVKTKINTSNWYRVWSDGWIEQGGTETAATYTATGSITYPYPFSNTNYTIATSNLRATNASSQGYFALNNKQTTGINWNLNAAQSNFVNTLNWYACGK